MSCIEIIASILSGVMALALLVMGCLFVFNSKKGFCITKHVPDALPTIMGGRYIALGAIIIGLMLMSDYSALSLTFATVAGVGIYDGIVTAKYGGNPMGHYRAGFFAFVLSALCLYAHGLNLEV